MLIWFVVLHIHKSTCRLSPIEANGSISGLCGQTITGWEEKGKVEKRKTLPASCPTANLTDNIESS